MPASHSTRRLAIMVLLGGIAAVLTGLFSSWVYAPAAGWAVAAVTFCGSVWSVLLRADDAGQTQAHATREDPSRTVSEILVLAANLASLAAIVVVMVQASHQHGAVRELLAGGALLSVAISWFLVQTLYTLRYALLYYSPPIGGVDFNQTEPPRYLDFAYVAFTIGMTYQVSDTSLAKAAVRATAMRHGLLSYLFGSVILATTINLVVTISTSSG